jgi:hypothetical protein
VSLPVNDKARKMQLLAAQEIAEACEDEKILQTGVGFEVVAA